MNRRVSGGFAASTVGRGTMVGLWAGVFVLAGAASRAGERTMGKRLGRELIRDRHFQQGFRLLAPQPGRVVVTDILPGIRAGGACWRLAQWSSRYSLAGVPARKTDDGGLEWRNRGKIVRISPPGSPQADIVLTVFGSAEYGGRLRKKGEPWPHLLVSQRFEHPPSIAALSSVRIHVEARLLESRVYKPAGYTPRLHAGQFQIFLTVQNLRRGAKGYGDFLYFGVPLYDTRYRHPHAFRAPDGAGKFIYTPPGTAYTRETFEPGRWVTIDRDILPLLKSALEEAWKRGFLQDSRDPDDYRISGMNMGWEIPGIVDAGMQVRNLSILIETREGTGT